MHTSPCLYLYTHASTPTFPYPRAHMPPHLFPHTHTKQPTITVLSLAYSQNYSLTPRKAQQSILQRGQSRTERSMKDRWACVQAMVHPSILPAQFHYWDQKSRNVHRQASQSTPYSPPHQQ